MRSNGAKKSEKHMHWPEKKRKRSLPARLRDISVEMGSGREEVASSSVLGKISVGIAFFYL